MEQANSFLAKMEPEYAHLDGRVATSKHDLVNIAASPCHLAIIYNWTRRVTREMETLVFTIDIIAFVAIIYYSIRNEKNPNAAETGPFRISEPISRPSRKISKANGFAKR